MRPLSGAAGEGTPRPVLRDLDFAARGTSSLRASIEAYERTLILAALTSAGGNQRKAAALLDLAPTTLHEKMKRLGIRIERQVAAVVAEEQNVKAFRPGDGGGHRS
jgi:DNA-binding NtrC family response regulator